MRASGKLAISCIVALGAVLLVRHAASALHPAVPPNMPADSVFVQSGYNLDRNEPIGDWIACHEKRDETVNTCRVTDAKGDVIYEGDFLPVGGGLPVPDSQIKVAAGGDKRDLWVNGPAEDAPVPVVPLASGQVLVPADDAAALADRWRTNPDELRRVQGQL